MDHESQSSTRFASTSSPSTSPAPDTLSNPQPTTTPSAPTFPLFPLLPLELRLQIFTHASSTHLAPILHQIDTRRGTFISNQPPHPLLHTSRLSRSTYLSTTRNISAFGTYVSFSRDIFYFPHFVRLDNLSKLRSFLDCPEIRLIRRFAVKRELFDGAWQVIFSCASTGGRGLEDEGEGEGLVGMEELLMVWRDWRVVREAWWEKGGGFREVGEGELMGRGRDNEHTGFLVRMCRERFGEREGEKGVKIRLGVVE
ncbi:hypothetical protein DL98DRAFT_657245 [Cadophora sp. DSE1049]|nr:hypothetical protein DL98DRAFT_657245 [Cadophora sp. DSE1049]